MTVSCGFDDCFGTLFWEKSNIEYGKDAAIFGWGVLGKEVNGCSVFVVGDGGGGVISGRSLFLILFECGFDCCDRAEEDRTIALMFLWA